MKYFTFFSTLILFLLLYSCQKKYGEIYYISMVISPTRSITCDDLRLSTTKKHLKLSFAENGKLITFIKTLKPIDRNLDIDARIYGQVYDGAKKLEFCSGIGVIEVNSKKYFVSDELKKYILELTKEK